jgi:hypothetical protein
VGKFLSVTHVDKVAGRPLPAAKTIRLSSGGAFVQATAEPLDVDAPPDALVALRDALSPVMPR